jgi:light-harvesting protein B-800-850 alpha chain
MNNARIWTIVSPNVGVPVFFLVLVFTSLFIHFQVMANTPWFSEYYAGTSAAETAE